MRFVYDPFTGRRDFKRVNEKYPQLGNKKRLSEEFPKELELLYSQYVSEISNHVMAASIELSRFAHAFCGTVKPHRIADLGSGFSSVVLRHHKMCRDPDACVWSVDDSEKWLEETRRFLNLRGLPSDNLLTWSHLRAEATYHFDFILYDLGHVRELRKEALETTLDMVAPGGVIVLDDMNFIGYKRHVKQILKKRDFEAYNIRGFTNDSSGRYSYLLARPPL